MDLIKFILDAEKNIQITINKWLALVAILALLFWLLYMKFSKRISTKEFEINEAEIGIGSQKIKIKPNYDDIQIAYKLWVELSTRKIGLPIDFDNDVIIEIYNSWFEFFRLTRDLIKAIPISRVRRNESTRILVNVSIDVLNEGLRPHLTFWQARFRKWYQFESEKPENRNISPQELEKRFPDYDKLTKDMRTINEKLIKYRGALKEIAIER